MKLLSFLLLFVFAVTASAQTPAPAAPIHTFALNAAPISLPGGGQTVMGSVSGATLTVTPNFDLREDNVLAPGSNFQGFFGGFNYRLPVFSGKLNNASPTLDGSRFQFYLTASAGIDRLTSSSADTKQHYAFLVGGGVNYDLTASGTWAFGAEVRYAKLPGLANNTAIVSVGPSFHF